jgi:opacity protein-like surface antigen
MNAFGRYILAAGVIANGAVGAASAQQESQSTQGIAGLGSDDPQRNDASLEFEPSSNDEGFGGWSFAVSPYLWVPNIKGHARAGIIPGDVDFDFTDWLDALSDELDIALKSRIEAHKDDLGLYVDFLYVSLDDESSGALATTSIEFEQVIIEFGVTYTLWESESGIINGKPAVIELDVGGRFYNISTDISLSFGGGAASSGGLSENWLDPTIGARLQYPLTTNWSLGAEADIGGFDLGSEFSWSVSAALQYKFSNNFSLFAGYRILDVDYDRGAGGDRFVFDVQMRGPMFGATFRF